MARRIIDYDGPTGAYLATGEGILPLTDPEAFARLAEAAMLTSLGHTDRAAEYERLIRRRQADKREPVRA